MSGQPSWCRDCQQLTSGDCGKHGNVWPVPAQQPFKCPCCDGTGKVSRPPHIAGDIEVWSDNQCGPYPCQPCNGSGVLWR